MINLECLGAWPSEITAQQAANGERIGIDYKLTNTGSTEQVVDVRGWIGNHSATATGEVVPPDGGVEYGTVFMNPTGIEDGAQVRLELAGQESDSGSGSDTDSGGDSGPTGSVTLDRVDTNSSVGLNEFLTYSIHLSSSYTQSAEVTATVYLGNTQIDTHTVTIAAGDTSTISVETIYKQLVDLGLAGTANELIVTLSSDAPVATARASGGTVSIAEQGDIRIRSISPSRTSIAAGDSLKLTCELENLTGSAQTVSIEFWLGGEVITSRTITVSDQLTTHTTTITYSDIESLFPSLLDSRVIPMALVTSPAVDGELKEYGELVSIAAATTASAPASASALSLSASTITRAFRAFSTR